MVTTITRLALGMIVGAVLIAQAVSAAELDIRADTREVELGRPIWLTLRSDQTTVSLKELDLSAWRDRVALPRDYDVELSEDNHSQSARLRLYPLRRGRLDLPGLHFAHTTTEAMRFEILPAREPGSGHPMDFRYRLSTHKPWQRQQVIVNCQLTLSDDYAVFRLSPHKLAGIQVRALQKQQQRVEAGAPGETRYRLGWLLTPSRAGDFQVAFPPIEYVRDGVVVRRFFVPPVTLQVRALPSWLPGTIPVGTVRLTNYAAPHNMLSSGVLSRLHLGLQLDGVAPELIPDYAQQLRSNRNWRFYAAQTRTTNTLDADGLRQRVEYTIPLQPRSLGLWRLPALRLQYFDPATGSLETANLQGPLLLVVNGWIKSLLALLLLLLGVYLGRRLWRGWQRYWYRYRTYQQAMRQLTQSDSLPALRTIMQRMAQAEGWRSNLTYRQWQARMQRVAPEAAQFPVTALNAASYAGASLDCSAIIVCLLRICRRRCLALR